jgi:hypothetical protein
LEKMSLLSCGVSTGKQPWLGPIYLFSIKLLANI